MPLADDLIVVDDCFKKPHEIRRFALGLPFVRLPGAPYAGAQTARTYSSPSVVARFEELVGRRLRFDPERDVFGCFRLSLAGEEGTTWVHFDSPQWAGVVYLSEAPDGDGREGTLFFRHRATGKTGPEVSIMSDTWEAHRAELVRTIIEPDSKRVEAWEIVHRVPLRFNRLVLFQGWKYFHAAGPSFGDSPESGRLTQNFFFNTGDGA